MRRDTSNDVSMTSKDLKSWMSRHGFTSAELADYLGMTKTGVDHWLTGKRRIPEPMGRLFNFFDLRPKLMKEF